MTTDHRTIRTPYDEQGKKSSDMEYRRLGNSGLRVSALSFGTATFAGTNEYYKSFGSTDSAEASRLIDICLDHGLNLFDSGNNYSDGAAEQVLGKAIKYKRDRLLISTKISLPIGPAPNDYGSSRHHLTKEVDKALKRLDTDYIDLLQMHIQDANTSVEETLHTLDQIVRSGKVNYIGCSNFAGWHLMKSLAISDRYGYPRYVAQQICYSIINRDYEWELMHLGKDQHVGALVWSPLANGRLSGKIHRDRRAVAGTRAHDLAGIGVQIDDERLFTIIDELLAISEETGRTVSQIAINYLLRTPAISSVIIGARNEEQLLDNLGAVGWNLTEEQAARIDLVSNVFPTYPFWFLRDFPMMNDKGW